MKKIRTAGVGIFLFVFCALTISCENREEPSTGPAEQLGREIDKAMEGAAQRAEEVQERLGKQLEQAGEEMQQEAE